MLAVPCASIVGGGLVLHVADPGGSLVLTTGMPRWGLWVNAAGDIVAEGSVTDEANGGSERRSDNLWTFGLGGQSSDSWGGGGANAFSLTYTHGNLQDDSADAETADATSGVV